MPASADRDRAEGRIMAKLKPWFHVVNPREDLRENRALDASEFAVHLDHVRQGRAPDDYTKPARFFDRTYMTKALLELCSQAVRRMSGIKVETSAVFNMATQFGGGKTHALTALYHLAKGGDAAKAWKGVDAILRKAQVPSIPKANVAVFVGMEFDVLQGRDDGHGPARHTPWGDIAWQLGGEESYRAVAEHDAKKIAPGGDVIRKMLPDVPCVILMDELLNFIGRGRKLGLGDELFNFLQNLCEEARARDNVVVCVSIPMSELEMNESDQRDHESFKKMLDRLGKAIMMSAETEAAEIIRRRLFEWNGLPPEGRAAAQQYADWAVEKGGELGGIDPSSARDVFEACYPFHPAVLSVFERKWQSLPRFQRTRGILRLLATWVAYASQKEHQRSGTKGDHLIGLGTAPIEDPLFRAAMFEQLGNDALEGPVTTDIAGKANAWAPKLDREASEEIRENRLHQKIATTILFESNGGQEKHRASVPEIKFAVGTPDMLLPNVDIVLDELTRSCYYLSQDGSYYYFSTTPNLNKILTDRRAAVSPTAIEQRVKKEIETVFKSGPRDIDLDRRYWPAQTNGVPEQPELTLIVLGLDHPARSKETLRWMEQLIRECGSSGRTMKSALIFAVPETPDLITAAARDVIAWEEIDDDEETKKRLDDAQRKQLSIGIGRAKIDFKESVWRTYRRLYYLDKNNTLNEADFGESTSSSASSIVELFINKLVKLDVISLGPGAGKLLKYWPPALDKWSTKAVRDAFFSSPVLPRLLRADVIKRTIADGVVGRMIGYARDDGRGGVKLDKFGDSMSEAEVEIADDVYILKADDAQKLLEPPKLSRLRIAPESVTIKPGEKATFTASGIDQYGDSYPLDAVSWEATGGAMDSTGMFSAADECGAFIVTARYGGVDASAQVRVQDSVAPPPPPPPSTLRWSGTVPPQKWMNFYTKILSKHATNPELQLTVTFEVPIPKDELPTREQETRSALRELGLDEGVSAG